MSDWTPIARSPIPTPQPTTVAAGWEVHARTSPAALTLTDATPLTKITIRAAPHGPAADHLGLPYGRTRRDADGVLLVGSGPGEWLALAPPGTATELTRRLHEDLAQAAERELVSIIDLTHGRAMLRLTGPHSRKVLAKLCPIDLSEDHTPNGAALRTTLARLATDLIRDDHHGQHSYLLHCETSSGRYLHHTLLDAGAEHGIQQNGFQAPGI